MPNCKHETTPLLRATMPCSNPTRGLPRPPPPRGQAGGDVHCSGAGGILPPSPPPHEAAVQTPARETGQAAPAASTSPPCLCRPDVTQGMIMCPLPRRAPAPRSSPIATHGKKGKSGVARLPPAPMTCSPEATRSGSKSPSDSLDGAGGETRLRGLQANPPPSRSPLRVRAWLQTNASSRAPASQ